MIIEDLIGKQFQDGGRGPDCFDCWGLVKFVYLRELGITLPDYTICAFDSAKVDEAIKRDRGGWCDLPSPDEGSVMMFSTEPTAQDWITHVGLSLGGGQFLHVIRGHNVSIAKLRNPYWGLRYKGAVKWQA